jgi:hypothetical protein
MKSINENQIKKEKFASLADAKKTLESRLDAHRETITRLIRERENEPRIGKKREIDRTLKIVKGVYYATMVELKGLKNGSF